LIFIQKVNKMIKFMGRHKKKMPEHMKLPRGPKERIEKKIDQDTVHVVVDDSEYYLEIGKPYYSNGREFKILYLYLGRSKTIYARLQVLGINDVWREMSVKPDEIYSFLSSMSAGVSRGSRFSKLNGLKYIIKVTGKNPIDLKEEDLVYPKFVNMDSIEFKENYEVSLAYRATGNIV